jgi:hypothetical protein
LPILGQHRTDLKVQVRANIGGIREQAKNGRWASQG